MKLHVLYTYDLKTFGDVTGHLVVFNNMSAITNFSGTLDVEGLKAVVTIDNIADDTDINTNICEGSAQKITIKNIASDALLTYTGLDSDSANNYIASGTTILYAPSDITDRIFISNTTETEKPLTAFYYKKTKEIKAEFAGAVTLIDDVTSKDYPNLDLAMENMTRSADYTVLINEPVTVQNLVIPKTANLVAFIGDELTIGNKAITIPVDTVFNCKLNFTAAGGPTVKVAADAYLEIDSRIYATIPDEEEEVEEVIVDFTATEIKSISGTKTSSLYIMNITVGDIKTFKDVTMAWNSKVNGNMSGIANFSGTLTTQLAKSVITIDNIDDDTTITYQVGLYDGSGIPKVTVNAVSDGKTLRVVKDSIHGGQTAMTPGTVVLYAKTADVADAVVILNKTSNGKELTAFYDSKTKKVTAEYEMAVTLYEEAGSSYYEIGNYKNVETALAEVTNGSYLVQLNASANVANLVIPKNADCITFTGQPITIGNKTLTIPADVDVVFEDIDVYFLNSSTASIKVGADSILRFVLNDVVEDEVVDEDPIPDTPPTMHIFLKSITGTKTSELLVHNVDLDVDEIKTFGAVDSTKQLRVEKSMSGITYFSGVLYPLTGSTVVIDEIYADSTLKMSTTGKLNSYPLPKVTINKIRNGAVLSIDIDNGASLEGGKAVFSAKTNILNSDKSNVVFVNKASNGDDLAPAYDAKKKVIYTAVDDGIHVYTVISNPVLYEVIEYDSLDSVIKVDSIE